VIYGAPMRGIAPCGACHGSLDNIARAMTPQEIDAAAAYYASQPPDVVKAVD